MYRTIILDFDGVLVESNDIKDRAFEMVFADYPEHLKEILAYHKRTGLIRFEKFKFITENILRQPYSNLIQDELARKFSDYCIREVIHCPWVRGAEDFLSYYSSRVPLYLVSINPPEDLHIILRARKMGGYFKGVFTATSSKASQIRQILELESLSGGQAVFIGDTINDFESARQAGVDFIGRRSANGLEVNDAPVFDNLLEISDFIKAEGLCQNI